MITCTFCAESAFEGKSEEEIEMMKVMGFGDFDSTKGKKVPGNDLGSANIVQKRRYRWEEYLIVSNTFQYRVLNIV